MLIPVPHQQHQHSGIGIHHTYSQSKPQININTTNILPIVFVLFNHGHKISVHGYNIMFVCMTTMGWHEI